MATALLGFLAGRAWPAPDATDVGGAAAAPTSFRRLEQLAPRAERAARLDGLPRLGDRHLGLGPLESERREQARLVQQLEGAVRRLRSAMHGEQAKAAVEGAEAPKHLGSHAQTRKMVVDL